MLETSLIESQPENRTKKPWTVTVSIVIHILAVTILLLVPLIYTAALPLADFSSQLLAPIPRQQNVDLVPVPARPAILKIPQVNPNDLIAPPAIPQEIAMAIDAPAAVPAAMPGIQNSGGMRSILQAALDGEAAAASNVTPPPPPSPPAAVPISPAAPIRVSAGVQQGNLIHQVPPVYPALARQARIQGVVILEAMIAKDGSVNNLRVVSGHPLLIRAAIDAVSQWQYRPTLLSGDPVEVLTTVTVTFRFGQ
jgi:periplasmic protein TonB